MVKMVYFVCFLCCCGVTSYAQQVIEIKDKDKILAVGKDVYFIEDHSAQLSLQDILKPANQRKFQKQSSKVFNRPASNTAFWFKITAKNNTGEDIWLKIGDSFNIWYADFYAPNASGKYVAPYLTGSLRARQKISLSSNFYCVPLAKRKDTLVKTYYLKLSGKGPQTYVFQTGTTLALSQHLLLFDYAVAFFIGLIAAMFLYNTFLFYSIRNKLYLVYMIYLLWVAVAITFSNGYSLFHATWLWNYFFTWNSLGYLFVTLFAVIYLNLPVVSPGFNRFIWIITSIMVVVFPVLNLSYIIDPVLLVNPYQVTLLVYYIALLSIGIVLWRRGHQNARFYTLAWGFVISSSIVFVLSINGILPYNVVTYHSMYIGFIFEALLFALALGDRLNTLKEEKQEAQAKNIALIKEQNEQLEQKVTNRTAELQKSQQEVLAQNEELLQTQEELETQRDFLDGQNSKLYQQNKKVHSSIKAAQSIQEAILPYQDKLDHLLKEYFVINRPKDVVSGDFYWLNELDGDIILAVADCTGHGVQGAFMTLIGSSLLDKIIYQDNVSNPEEVLNQLHHQINKKLQAKDAMRSNGMDIVMLSLRKNDDHTLIQYSGAKNSLFYVDAAQPAQLHEIKGTNKSIGGEQNEEREFVLHEFRLPANSLIYLGSDGLMDQNNVKRKKFSKNRLKTLLHENAHLPLANQKQQLEQALDTHMKDTDQRDDILWFGVRV